MTTIVERKHPGTFIVSEGPGFYSRDPLTIPQSQDIKVGAVLGCVADVASATTLVAAVAGNTGNGVLAMDGTAPVRGDARTGVYQVLLIEPAANGGSFEVADPEGVLIGTGVVGTVFNGPIKFTLADGAADFVAGDRIQITVSVPKVMHKPVNAAATDGSQFADAIAIYPAVTGVGETARIAGLRRKSEVRATDLEWPSGSTPAQIAQWTHQLAKRGIITR